MKQNENLRIKDMHNPKISPNPTEEQIYNLWKLQGYIKVDLACIQQMLSTH